MRFPVNFIGISQNFTPSHKGIDLGWNSNYGGPNQSVYACAKGKVTSIQKQTLGGNVIFIDHENGLTSEYGHLQDNSIKVKVGDVVSMSQPIANMGATGKVSGNHLHFGLYTKTIKSVADIDKNKTVNPLDYLEVYPGQNISANTLEKYKLKYYTEYKIGKYKTLANIFVRMGPGTNYAPKKVKNLTLDGKKNATSKNLNADALYKKGTVFDALEIINNGTLVWSRTPSGYVNIKNGNNINCQRI